MGSCDECGGTVGSSFATATILSVEFNSAFLFRNQVRGEPQNSFSVFLDLSRTDILDMRTLSLMPSSNTSNAQISGINTTWVNGVYGELHTFFQNRATARSWLHGRYTYDALVILLGFPASFLVVREADRFLRPLVKWPEALLVAFYVYLVLVALFGFRILFNYARWVFPKIEVTSTHQPGVLHKSILVMVAAAVVSWVVESVLTVFTHGLSK